MSFASFFGGLTPTPVVLSTATFKVDIEFIALARELIDEFIEVPNAIWSSISDGNSDPSSPWSTTRGGTVDHAVKIYFFRDTRQDREFLRYMAGMSANIGDVNGIMYQTDFEPSTKDSVTFNDRKLAVKNVNALQPVDRAIVYFMEFGV